MCAWSLWKDFCESYAYDYMYAAKLIVVVIVKSPQNNKFDDTWHLNFYGFVKNVKLQKRNFR